MKLTHVGHVVKDFDAAVKFYKEKMNLTPTKVIEFPEFGSRMAFFPFGDIEIELISPGGTGADPAAKCLQERGEGLFHLSFAVEDIGAEVKKWRACGFTIDEFTNKMAEHIAHIAFLRPEETYGLWIEFIHEEKI